MKLVIEKDAQRDVESVARFYDKGEPGVGLYFITQFRREADELRIHGGIHRKRCGLHFCQVKSFPVAIYYHVVGEEVHICAVIDCRRNPEKIQRILRYR